MNNKFDIKKQLLPLYLIVVVLLQIDLTVQNILLGCLPLVLIFISIHLRNKKLGIIGIFLFYIISIPQIVVSNMENFLFVSLELFLLVLPSIVLLSFILQLDNPEIFYLSDKKKPLIIASSILITIIVIFYLLTSILWKGFLLSSESIEGQILLLTGITIVCCTPFLISRN